MELLNLWVQATWELVLETAPWLLLGLLAAGLVDMFLSTDWVAARLGRRSRHPILLASILGVPLPLCSCSVLPTAATLRRNGASKGSTAAFLVSTPETGPDSIGITFGLFDPLFAILRPFMALWSAIVVGMWVDHTEGDSEDGAPPPEPDPHHHCETGCEEDLPKKRSVTRMLRFVLGPLWSDLAPSLAVGFALAGLFSAALPAETIQRFLPAGILGMLAIGLMGIPLSICATASTPLAAALVDKGLGPGAALVLLLTGPATNLATLGVVRGMIGSRGLAAYLGGIFAAALGGGLVVESLYSYLERPLRHGQAVLEHHEHGLLAQVSAVLVCSLFAWYALGRLLARGNSK
ncbi:MAG: SO_0444 family Cu/Zn efflux transporter [Planctomycetota bacterium]|nr:SO_0444 family Cu/Zn efflux transporter [Planctomycetota bacterium]